MRLYKSLSSDHRFVKFSTPAAPSRSGRCPPVSPAAGVPAPAHAASCPAAPRRRTPPPDRTPPADAPASGTAPPPAARGSPSVPRLPTPPARRPARSPCRHPPATVYAAAGAGVMSDTFSDTVPYRTPPHRPPAPVCRRPPPYRRRCRPRAPDRRYSRRI